MGKLLCKLFGHRYRFDSATDHVNGDKFISFKCKRCGRYEGRWCKEN